jgi:hypothetical protein
MRKGDISDIDDIGDIGDIGDMGDIGDIGDMGDRRVGRQPNGNRHTSGIPSRDLRSIWFLIVFAMGFHGGIP